MTKQDEGGAVEADESTVNLTPARRRVLEVLVRWNGRARYSNETDRFRGHVYWQSSNWLEKQGYVRRCSLEEIELTHAGKALAARLIGESGA